MSGPENLMLVLVHRLDANMAELRADVTELKHRMTAIETQGGQLVSTEASHYASVATRLDRIGHRLGRLERHADILPA